MTRIRKCGPGFGATRVLAVVAATACLASGKTAEAADERLVAGVVAATTSGIGAITFGANYYYQQQNERPPTPVLLLAGWAALINTSASGYGLWLSSGQFDWKTGVAMSSAFVGFINLAAIPMGLRRPLPVTLALVPPTARGEGAGIALAFSMPF